MEYTLIYKTKSFESTFKKANISDADLIAACDEISKGLVDADLGAHLYKKRVAMPGHGKSGSYRTLIGAVVGDRYFFLYMFAKSDRSNVNNKEKIALQELAKEFVGYDQDTLDSLVKQGVLTEVRKSK